MNPIRDLSFAALLGISGPLACQGSSQSSQQPVDKAEEHVDHPAPSDGTDRTVQISTEAISRVGIRLAVVEAVPSGGGLVVSAEIVAEPDRVAHVSSVVSGQIGRVNASVGDRVKAGQTLAVIRSVALGAARADAARAQASVEVARANFLRQQELKREGIGAQRYFLEAKAELARAEAELSAARRVLEVYGRGGTGSEVRLQSPIAGRVVSRHATVGEVVSPSDVLFEVTDISTVWAVGRVYQQNAGQLTEGLSAVLTLQALPGRSFSGTLDYVAPQLDETTRTLPIHMTLDNPEGVLRPGFFGRLSVASTDSTVGTLPVVQTTALQRIGSDTVVFVPEELPGRFRAVSVGVGSRAQGVVTLMSGLSVGDQYVVDGAFVLKSELSRGQLGEGHAH